MLRFSIEKCVDAFYQRCSSDRFLDKQYADSRCALTELGIGKTGHENRGHGALPFTQLSYDIQAIHLGHVVIHDQAAAKGWQTVIVQEFFGGRVYAHIEPFNPEREIERISHGRVIIKHEENMLCIHRSA